jgi:Ring finger domain
MNSCAICLDPLSSKSAGTCVPCGHCFHVECFDGWKAASHSKQSSKCPTCNTKAKTFCRLYLDFNQNNNANDSESDSVSEESCEGSNDGEFVEREREVTDLTCSRGMSNNSRNKYKEKLRRLKDLYSRTNAQLKEKTEEHRNLSSVCEKNRVELSDVTNSFHQEIEIRTALERKNESLNLQCIRLKNEIKESLQKIKDENKAARTISSKLKMLEDSYQRDIANAQANSLKEVKGILEQYPKVVNENKVLKEIIRNKDDKIGMLRKQSGFKRSSDTDNNYPCNSAKRALKVAQMLDQHDDSHRSIQIPMIRSKNIHKRKNSDADSSMPSNDAKSALKVAQMLHQEITDDAHRNTHRKKQEDGFSVDPYMMTSHAARISRACNIRLIGKLTDACDLLNGADRSQRIVQSRTDILLNRQNQNRNESRKWRGYPKIEL